MRILHTADWHLGKRLENIPRLEEQAEVLDEICRLAEEHEVDAVLIAGDLYDTFKPPVEAEDLFYRTVKRLSANGKRAVVAIAGNHDSPDRIAAPDPLARECGIILSGYPTAMPGSFLLETGLQVLRADEGFVELELPGTDVPLRLLLMPYANESRLRSYIGIENPEEELRMLLQDRWQELAEKYCDDKGVNILMAHLLLMRKGDEQPEEPEAERSIIYIGGAQSIYSENIPAGIQYTALGHLHRYQCIDRQPCPVIYSGSPLCYSMGEAGQEKYVVFIEAEPGQPVKYEPVRLEKGRQLYRKRFNEVPAAVEWLTVHREAIVELTMETETYLTPDERKQLAQAHDSIIGPIPLVRQLSLDDVPHQGDIDLTEDIRTLFRGYFRVRHNQEPNQELMDMFEEVLRDSTIDLGDSN